jgi:hypothetical protein
MSDGATANVGSIGDAGASLAGALTAAAEKLGPGRAGNRRVTAVVQLGWLLAGASSPLDTTQLQVLGLQLRRLVATASLDWPQPDQATSAIAALVAGTGSVGELTPALEVALKAGDSRFEKAFELGQGLQALSAPSQLDLEARVTALIDHLDALSTALPAHAARAVALSLADWVKEPDDTLRAAQVELWRAVLVDDKAATELLEPDDYTRAGGTLARRVLTHSLNPRRHLGQVVIGIAVVAILIGVGLWFLLSPHGQTGKVAAAITSVLATLGLTWKGIGGTVGNYAARLEAPLWGAELDAAVAVAVTLEPEERTPSKQALERYSDRAARARTRRTALTESSPPSATTEPSASD